MERDLAVFVVDTSRAENLSKELGVQKTGIIVCKLSLDVPGGTPLARALSTHKGRSSLIHATRVFAFGCEGFVTVCFQAKNV